MYIILYSDTLFIYYLLIMMFGRERIRIYMYILVGILI